MDLSPEQAAIVGEAERDLVVTAGAGSGKTHVLVERYVKLLESCTIDQIAAVTFTDAAAAEMRERVRRAVLERPDLEKHRASMDDAIIGTIHSLCRRILREHPVEAALDPNVRVLADDEAEAALLSASIDALEEAANANDRRVLSLEHIGTWELKQLLPQMVARRDEVRNAYAAMPGSTVEEWARNIQHTLTTSWAERAQSMRDPVISLINAVKDAFSGDPTDVLWGKVQAALETMGDFHDAASEQFAPRLQAAFGPFNLVGGSAKNWSGDVAAARGNLRALREMASALADMPQWNDYDEPALRTLESLQLVFDDACARYADAKRVLAAVDYLDLELQVGEMLGAHPQVAAEYHTRFKHVLVDELQDTNPTQIRLIELLTQPSNLGTPHPRRFLVGDIKQAIYRFRGSEVAQFAALRDGVANQGAAHALSRSFRGHDRLVGILNELFEAVFGEAKAPYEAPMEPMSGRGGDPPTGPSLTVITVEKIDDPGAQGTPASRIRRAEADQLGAEIDAILAAPKQVWDRTLQAYRDARPSDVAILLRRLTNVHIFERALESRGIPYRTPGGAGFFTRQEVVDLTNLLRWLAEPDDEIALVGALRSPLFMIDDQSLLRLRQHKPNLLQSLGEPPAELGPGDYARCTHAAAVLNELRTEALTQSADSLLQHALELTDFEASWAPIRGGDQAVANIRKLVSIARQLADHSVDEVVDYLEARRDELSAREGLAVMDDSDAVRLMTIHGAKGLEFPIVCIPEADVSLRAASDTVRWRSNDGISLTLSQAFNPDSPNRPRPGFYSHLGLLDQREDDAEYKRLFYVAATRAGDALFISGDASAPKGSWLSEVQAALGASTLEGIDLRPPAPADMNLITGRPGPQPINPPSVASEQDLLPPLIARPRVVPLRSSTPVTALRSPETHFVPAGHGDQLGLVRGNLAHKAAELWFTNSVRPDLTKVLRDLGETIAPAAEPGVIADVEAMLDLLGASPLAGTLAEDDTTAYFELPFSWDWDGVPVHGTIDLAYKTNDQWHVIDFKTDQLRGRSIEEAAAPYLPQLALYAGALEKATGSKPQTGLLFLRTGEHFIASDASLADASTATRARIEVGDVLEVPADADQIELVAEA